MARWTMTMGLAAVGLAGLGLGACDKSADASGSAVEAGTTAAADGTLTQTLDKADGLSATARLVKAAGLDKTFGGVGSYTLFAPTDAAIAALPEADRTALESPEGRAQLIALLSSHVSPGYVGQADLDTALERAGGSMNLASVGAAPIKLHKDGDRVMLGDGEGAARIAGAAIVASNGVIYPIDRVLPTPQGQ